MGTKKAGHASSSSHDESWFATTVAHMKNVVPAKWGDTETTIVLVAVGVAAAVILSAALRSSMPADSGVTKAAPSPAPVRAASTAPAAAPTPSGAKTAAQESPVTITGCLEENDDAFRLKDTTGVDAPKSRSWKSGFLKKGSATIEVIDSANRLKLPSHVGERVVVTGMLVDREMRVSSLRRLSASCKEA